MAKIADVQEVSLEKLRPYERNAKKHGQNQIEKLKKSIIEFGFLTPCLIDRDFNIIAGHGRVMAAKELGIEAVPCVFIEGLTEEQRRAYILADNRLGELGEWDFDTVEEELRALDEADFDITLTGFNLEDFEFDEGRIEAEGQLNPIKTLPESKVYIYAISVFGVESEKIAMVKLPQETADNFLQAAEHRSISEIVESLVGAINDL